MLSSNNKTYVLTIFSEPTLLTFDSVDPNVYTLAASSELSVDATFLLFDNAVKSIIDEACNSEDSTDTSQYNMSWPDFARKHNSTVCVFAEDLENAKIMKNQVNSSIKIIEKTTFGKFLNDFDHVIIY
tara:strand:+ start:751 stop:1134 length:384 start_codon:yes stop_codon:yes gene_type:complete